MSVSGLFLPKSAPVSLQAKFSPRFEKKTVIMVAIAASCLAAAIFPLIFSPSARIVAWSVVDKAEVAYQSLPRVQTVALQVIGGILLALTLIGSLWKFYHSVVFPSKIYYV